MANNIHLEGLFFSLIADVDLGSGYLGQATRVRLEAVMTVQIRDKSDDDND